MTPRRDENGKKVVPVPLSAAIVGSLFTGIICLVAVATLSYNAGVRSEYATSLVQSSQIASLKEEIVGLRAEIKNAATSMSTTVSDLNGRIVNLNSQIMTLNMTIGELKSMNDRRKP
jgi:hypothetical protein